MRAVKAQYFCAFAVMGCIVPYLAVFLAARGLGEAQIGLVLATTGVAIMLSPVFLTLVADAHLENRALLRGGFLISALALVALWTASGFWALFGAFALFSLAFWPLLPLQDGLNFAVRQRRSDAGHGHVPYHHVRVFGTLGFIVPSLALWGFLRADWDIGVVLLAGILACLVGAGVTLTLPRVRADGDQAEPGDEPSRLPTAEAGRRMLEPHLLTFAAAIWLVHLSASAYYAFYPLYLTRVVGLGEEWVGLIANLGVAIEVFFMMGFGLLVRRMGLGGLLAVGSAAIALRAGLLFAFPNVAVAVLTQLLHGITVLVLHVAPPVYLNHHAEPRFRNSMQGFYAMAVFGTGRVIGNVLAGQVAEIGILEVFALGAVLALLAAPLFALALKRDPVPVVEP